MPTEARHYSGVGDYGGAITGPGNRTNVFAVLDLLERARPQLVLDIGCDMKNIPRNKNETIRFRRAVNPTVSTSTVTEGVNPASRGLAYEDVSGTLGEYAEIFEVTSRMRELGEDDAVRDSADVLADLVSNTKEAVSWAAYIAGSNVTYSGSASARNQVIDVIGLGDIQTATRSLAAAKAGRYTQALKGSLESNTYPIEGAFYAFCHTDLEPDLRNVPGFITTAQYGGKQTVSEFEFGSVEKVRFITTPQLTPVVNAGAALGGANVKSTGGANADVYPIIICGKHARGTVSLNGTGKKGYGGVKINVLDGASKSDPTNQRSYVACRWWDLKLILNDAWLVRLEVAVTDDLSILNP